MHAPFTSSSDIAGTRPIAFWGHSFFCVSLWPLHCVPRSGPFLPLARSVLRLLLLLLLLHPQLLIPLDFTLLYPPYPASSRLLYTDTFIIVRTQLINPPVVHRLSVWLYCGSCCALSLARSLTSVLIRGSRLTKGQKEQRDKEQGLFANARSKRSPVGLVMRIPFAVGLAGQDTPFKRLQKITSTLFSPLLSVDEEALR